MYCQSLSKSVEADFRDRKYCVETYWTSCKKNQNNTLFALKNNFCNIYINQKLKHLQYSKTRNKPIPSRITQCR